MLSITITYLYLIKFIDLTKNMFTFLFQVNSKFSNGRGCSSLVAPTSEGGKRVTVHHTKGQLQITQAGPRQSTSRCIPGPAPRSRASLLLHREPVSGAPPPRTTVFAMLPSQIGRSRLFSVRWANENDYTLHTWDNKLPHPIFLNFDRSYLIALNEQFVYMYNQNLGNNSKDFHKIKLCIQSDSVAIDRSSKDSFFKNYKKNTEQGFFHHGTIALIVPMLPSLMIH